MEEIYKGKENTYRVMPVVRNKWVIQRLQGENWVEEYNDGDFDTEQEAIELVKELVAIEES